MTEWCFDILIYFILKIDEMTKDKCQGFEVFPPSTFYPIKYENWERYFEMSNHTDTMLLINEARAIHVWNKYSANKEVHDGSPYSIVAQKYCPLIYQRCGKTL